MIHYFIALRFIPKNSTTGFGLHFGYCFVPEFTLRQLFVLPVGVHLLHPHSHLLRGIQESLCR